MFGNGAGVLIIIIPRVIGDGDLVALSDELVGSADVFVEAVLGKFHKVEEFTGVELAPGGHRETALTKHGFETIHGAKNLRRDGFGGGIAKLITSEISIGDFTETTDGHFELVIVT